MWASKRSSDYWYPKTIILSSQLNSSVFYCPHLYGTLFASIVWSGAENTLFGAI